MPGFQYDEAPFDPLVQKCTFCEPRLLKASCPAVGSLPHGRPDLRRSDLLKIARARIAENPERYTNYVYGEADAGGTAWMVLAPAAPKAVPAAADKDAPAKDAHAPDTWSWSGYPPGHSKPMGGDLRRTGAPCP